MTTELPLGYEWVTEWHELLRRSPYLSASDEERLAEIEDEHKAQIDEIANSPLARLVAAELDRDFAVLRRAWGWGGEIPGRALADSREGEK